VQFLQSQFDFPQMVTLGEKTPSFGLNRFKQKLRFIPTDDEGFSLRGDKQHFLYKGRRRSHRFTILGDNSFEYDTILKKEPDSNVIRLRIEGSENFDFLRQPDFVKNPFLQGSYAVYKKVTLIGEGTGKLCHIHRPEIIDARGRRSWGSLAIVGNELQITIPEQWLSEATYPVIVDPTVGTTTVGAFTNVYHPSYQSFTVYFYREFGLEKFILPDNFNGQGIAYFYSNNGNDFNDTTPVMYTNNNNTPNTKISSAQAIEPKYPNSLNVGWLSGNFNVNTFIGSGTTVWFGLFSYALFPRCDYNGSLVTLESRNREIYTNFPANEMNYNDVRFGLKVSMYFTYVAAAGNNYSKTLVETARVNDNVSKAKIFLRYCVETVRINMTLNATRILAKICHLIDSLYANTSVLSSKGIYIKVTDQLMAKGSVIRKLFVSLRIRTNSFVRSIFNKRFLNSKVEITLKSRIGETNRNEELGMRN